MKRVQVMVMIDVDEDQFGDAHLRWAEQAVSDELRRLDGVVSVEWVGSEDVPEVAVRP